MSFRRNSVVAVFAAILSVSAQSSAAISTTTEPVSTLEDLRSLLRDSQQKYAIAAIPTTEIFWEERTDDIFVDWKQFPQSVKELAIATLDENLIPRYEIHLWESSETGIITIANKYSQVMAKLEPEEEFDPLGWAMDYFGVSVVGELTGFQQIIHASHHTALSLTLTPVAFEEACADIREEEQALAMQEAAMTMGGLAMMSLPESPTNLVLAINSTNTNAVVEILIGYPETFTNRVEVYATTNLIEGVWEIVSSSPLITTGQTSVTWTDTQTNLQFRAYRAGNADLDTDGDGLVDAREILLYKTNPELEDSDGDFMSDAWELQYSLDPINSLDMILDPDHDMLPNVYEHYYGLNPNSADSSSITKLRVDPANAGSPNTFASIQEAFTASTNYSIIEIEEGTYGGSTNVGLFFPDHPIMLMSDNWGTNRTTVVEYDGGLFEGIPAAFMLDEGQDNRTIIRGLALEMSGANRYQVGFWIGDGKPFEGSGSAPVFDGVEVEQGNSDVNIGYFCRHAHTDTLIFNNCVFQGKQGATNSFRGIYAVDSSPLKIANCTFQNFPAQPYAYGVQLESTSGNYGNALDPVIVEIANSVWDESFAASNTECYVRREYGVDYEVQVSDSIMPAYPSWFPPDYAINLYVTNALLSVGGHQTTNSPGMNYAGTPLTWYDFEGQERGLAPDIGADEYGNYSAGDSDHDGLSDLLEATVYFTDMYDSDTDGDSILDGTEVDDATSPTNAYNYMLTISGSSTNQLDTNVTLRACCSHTSGVWNASASTSIDSSGEFDFEDFLVDTSDGLLWVQVLCDWNMNGVADSDEPLYQQAVVAPGRQYACEFIVWDRDGDGVDDLNERLCDTDPNDLAHYCVTILGTVSNNTHFAGTMGVALATGPIGQDIQASTSVTATNTFLFDHLEVTNSGALTFHLFNDTNSNVVYDVNELSVPNMMVVVTGATMGVTIEFTLSNCDDDEDRIVDFWEQSNGLSWTNNIDAFADPDGDWIDNMWEYRLQLDPDSYDTNNYAFADAMQAVDSRIEGKNPATSLKIYSTQDHGNTNYVRNTNCWAADIDLTSCSPWNSYNSYKRAGTLISSRHALFVNHIDFGDSFWVPAGYDLRFVDETNGVYTATIDSVYHLTNGVDLTVAVLEEDIPTNRFSIAKVLPDNFTNYIGKLDIHVPGLCLDQEEKALIHDVDKADTVGVTNLNGVTYQYPIYGDRINYNEPLVGGDSGNPGFIILNNEVVLLTVWHGGWRGSGSSVNSFKSEINTIMNQSGSYSLQEFDFSDFDEIPAKLR